MSEIRIPTRAECIEPMLNAMNTNCNAEQLANYRHNIMLFVNEYENLAERGERAEGLLIQLKEYH